MTHEERRERRRKMAEYVQRTGCSLDRAAREFGVGIATVHSALVESGVGMTPVRVNGRDRRTRIAEAARERISDLPSVAKEFGVTVDYVRRAMRENGVPVGPRPAIEVAPRTLQIVADLINTDTALVVLAAKYRVTPVRIQQVYADCRNVGIPVQVRRKGRAFR